MLTPINTATDIGARKGYHDVHHGDNTSNCSTTEYDDCKKDIDQIRNSRVFPCIVACGYKHFVSYKSGQTFPAFLVQFGPSVFFWRSKREFLQLCKDTKQNSSSDENISFPKKIYSKVVARAPWIHPSYLILSNVHSKVKNNEAIAIEVLKKIMDPSNNPDDVAIIQSNNNYQPDLKKSVHILDNFLKKHQALKTREWIHFERNEDSAQLTVAPYPKSRCNENDTFTSHTSQSQRIKNISSAYGQYFASPENVQFVVQMISDYVYKLEKGYDKNIIICEPSCGDGRLIQSFLQHQDIPKNQEMYNCEANKNIDDLPYLVIGYDIDENAIEQSQKRLSQFMRINDFTENNIILKHTNVLLQSSPRLMAKHNTHDSILIVFGGPPYTSGPGHGTNIERNLPEQFVRHVTKNWNADFIAFILPKRYESFDWSQITNSLSSQFNEKDKNNSHSELCFDYDSKVFPLPNSYFYENNNVDDKVRARDKRKIQQPSILITWTRKKTSFDSMK